MKACKSDWKLDSKKSGSSQQAECGAFIFRSFVLAITDHNPVIILQAQYFDIANDLKQDLATELNVPQVQYSIGQNCW